MERFQSPSATPPPKLNSALTLRPVVFVIDATTPAGGGRHNNNTNDEEDDVDGHDIADEPFDVQRSSFIANSSASSIDEENIFEFFLAALRGKIPGGAVTSTDEEIISLAPSYASSGGEPLDSPTRTAAGETDGLLDEAHPSSPGGMARRFLSLPFTRNLRVGRWKATSPRKQKSKNNTGDDESCIDDDYYNDKDQKTADVSMMMTTRLLAQDMEDDPDDAASPSAAALNSYSKNNPPVHFMSKRARIVSVSSRHAFPPSKFPRGKLDPNNNNNSNMASSTLSSSFHSGGGRMGVGAGTTTTMMMLGEKPPPGSSGASSSTSAWVSSYEIQNEGIFPSGWMEKHARALPSAIIVVTTLILHWSDNDREQQQQLIGNAVCAVEVLRSTLAEKRITPFHLVCLLKVGGDAGAGRERAGRRDETLASSSSMPMARLQQKIDTIREKLCQECNLPQSQVFLIKLPHDLEPDEFESRILRSPYNNNNISKNSMPPSFNANISDAAIVMSPLLRQLDRSLRDTSAMYYSRLAEAQERKLSLWRNRFHTTNASFELNTLLAAMRCARYAIKVGILRELQLRTGGGAAAAAEGGMRWSDSSSLAMTHYDEAYRWLVELHQRAISWRAISMAVSSAGIGGKASTYPSPAPKTPGDKTYSMDDIKSPTFSESPGGGIGVELSFPGSETYLAAAPPPPLLTGATPPTRRDSPALTSKKGYVNAENIAFFASLWEQCRAVASIINVKLLRATTISTSKGDGVAFGSEVEEQWNRHRAIFLSNPHSIPGFQYYKNDGFFGPVWHRSLYVTEEMLTYACIAEGRWRRALELHAARTAVPNKNNTETIATASMALSVSYHLPGAPWRAYGELCEAILGLRRVVMLELNSGGRCNTWLPSNSAVSSRRKFVGSVALGSTGFGGMSSRFESVSKRDHRAMALDYVLHALDLLDVHISYCCKISTHSTPSSAVSEVRQPMSSARLHYLAARLFMNMSDPLAASVHLKLASSVTKSWPALQLSIQRALIACADRNDALTREHDPPTITSVLPNTLDVKGFCIEILLHPGKCKLLSAKEMIIIQGKAWKSEPASVNKRVSPREVMWTQYDASKSESPFEFAVSFLRSTHATSGDDISACVSIKSRLGFPVNIESIQLITSSGLYEVPNLDCCTAEKSLHWSLQRRNLAEMDASDHGILFKPNDLKFFLTELSLPTNLCDVLSGDISSDTTKFTPKNCRLCNMGFSHAAGSICEMRIKSNGQQCTSVDGKPVPISCLSKSSSSFLGGIPWVCTGVVLTLKHVERDEPIKLQIQCPSLFSPLLRSGALKFVMEESNYTSHSWSRPAHHPLCLGPRVLRVLGPRPQMRVTNLTRPLTDCKLVMGTVNRILFRLDAGKDEDCWDLRVKVKSTSSKKQARSSESAHESPSTGGSGDDICIQRPTFVCRAVNPTVKNVLEAGVTLPVGWEPRKDVGSDAYHDTTTSISNHLGAGKSFYFSLDVFHPLDQSFTSSDTCITSYEATFLYKQVRVGKQTNPPIDMGDQVMVIECGSFEWISPFTIEFSHMNGHIKPFPCGIQHTSNMISQFEPVLPSAVGAELIAADGERIQMRFSLGVKALGSQVAANILRVSNEKEANENQKELYSAGIGVLTNKLKQGSTLSFSYSVLAQKDIESGDGYDSIPLGVISVDWKPAILCLPEGSSPIINADEFGSAHGPLHLSGQSSMICRGPQCKVLASPFVARLLKCPATPKVGTPFSISYLVTNKSAKSQAVVVRLNDEKAENATSPPAPQLLGTGKVMEEMELAPFEERVFSFTYISMFSGKVLRPSLSVSSSRHQTWVVNETPLSPRHLFVLP